jgi:hypothetical protein
MKPETVKRSHITFAAVMIAISVFSHGSFTQAADKPSASKHWITELAR